jgi:hypothetical protein
VFTPDARALNRRVDGVARGQEEERMRDVKDLTEDERWEIFIRELAGLMNASPAIREEFIDKVRPREGREGVFN